MDATMFPTYFALTALEDLARAIAENGSKYFATVLEDLSLIVKEEKLTQKLLHKPEATLTYLENKVNGTTDQHLDPKIQEVILRSSRPFPGVMETLAQTKTHGTPVVLVTDTNTENTLSKLAAAGFGEELFYAIYSKEATRDDCEAVKKRFANDPYSEILRPYAQTDWAKPSTIPVDEVMTELKLPLQGSRDSVKAVFIGDSPKDYKCCNENTVFLLQYQGARHAGQCDPVNTLVRNPPHPIGYPQFVLSHPEIEAHNYVLNHGFETFVNWIQTEEVILHPTIPQKPLVPSKSSHLISCCSKALHRYPTLGLPLGPKFG